MSSVKASSQKPAARPARVTMQDVANALGVSQATVSQVLSEHVDRYRISEDTQQRVRDMAQKLGYRRNHSARSMRLGRSMAIGLVMTSQHNFFSFSRYPRMIRGLATQVTEDRHQLRLMVLEESEQEAERFHETDFLHLEVDGIVIADNIGAERKMERTLSHYRVPAVWANVLRKHDCVVPDEVAAIEDIVQSFARHGHKHIGYIDYGHSGHFSHGLRRESFVAECNRLGIKSQPIEVDHRLEFEDAERKLTPVLRSADRPTAFVALGAENGQALLWIALTMQFKVPDDLSIIVLHDSELRGLGVRLAVKRIPFIEIGAAAGRLLQTKIEAPDEPMPPMLVPYDPVKPEGSLGPAPKR